MNTIEPRPGNAHDNSIEIADFYDLRAELRTHSATDALQFDQIKFKLEEISKLLNRISWAGWPIAVGVLTLLYHSFAK
jgi:hypothetical protein